MFRKNWGLTILFSVLLVFGLAACGGSGGGSDNELPVVDAGEDQAGFFEGDMVSFSGSFSDADVDDTHTFEWDFGDGSTTTGTLTPTHVFTDNGDFLVTLTVMDDQGGHGQDTLTVSVANVAPVLDAGEDQSVSEGDAASFAASVTDPGTSDTFTYEWDFDDGSAVSNSADPTHAFPDNGIYTVTLTVTDDDGDSDTDDLTVTVSNVAPVADAGTDQSVDEGDTVNFSGTATDAGTGDTHTYEWDFDDGDTASGTLIPDHVYEDNGTYTVTLTVTDDDGGFDTDTMTVTVSNVAPVAGAGTDQSVDEGDTVNFSGTATDAGTGDTHTYEWDFDDGDTASGTLAPTHVFADNGTYTVTLTVTDDDGGFDTATMTVTVANVAPVANAGPDQPDVDEGETVNFSGTATDAGTGDTLYYAWQFGDGNTTSGTQTPSHVYPTEGVYVVTLTVTDDDGDFDTDTLTVTVGGVAPVVDAGPNQSGNEGQNFIFDDSSFVDEGSVSWDYSWDFGDGSAVSTSEDPTHVYADNGSYTVTLRITDDDGYWGEDTLTVTVANVAPTVDAGSDPAGINEGGSVAFSAPTIDDPGSDSFFYSWDFGDGSAVSTSDAPTHVYDDDTGGPFTVRVTVRDDDGGSDYDELTVTVTNVAPSVDAGLDPAGILEGGSVPFSAPTIDDPGSDSFFYSWDFGDGSAVSTSAAPTHIFDDDTGGPFTVRVTVRDDDGGSDYDELTVTVTNVAPSVDAGPDPAGINEGGSVVFSAPTIDDPGSDSYSYSWDFGDGSPVSTSDAPTHVYDDDTGGPFTVTVTVRDDDGGSDYDELSVEVTNVDPVVDAGEDQEVDEDETVNFDGSFTDAGTGDTHTIEWDFDDGDTAIGTLTPTHAFSTPGEYTVLLTVTDDDAGVGTDSLIVTVNSIIPDAPTGLAVTDTTSTASGGTSVSLSWTDNADNETGYYVERDDDGLPFDTDHTFDIAAGSTTYTDDTVAPNSTYHYRVAAYNLAGTSGYAGPVAAATPVMDLGSVGPFYDTYGEDWNDYIENDGPSIYEADNDGPAPATGTGGYYSVIHGGEMRAVEVPGLTDCTGVTVVEDLGAFDWVCLDGSPVQVVSTGLRDGMNLSDLIDFTGPSDWMPNYITVLLDGQPYGYTPSETWWANPVFEVSDTSTLDTQGAIYAVPDSFDGYLKIGEVDKVAVVTAPGAVITGSDTVHEVLMSDMGDGSSFLWIEADLMGAPGTTHSILKLMSTQYSVVRNTSVSGSANGSGVHLYHSKNNLLTGISAVDNAGDDTAGFDEGGGIWLELSDENRLYDLRVGNNGAVGLDLAGSDGNIINGVNSYNNEDRGIRVRESSADNVLVNVTYSASGRNGLQLWDSNGNVLANLTGTNVGGETGLMVQNSDRNTVVNYAGVNDRIGLFLWNNGSGDGSDRNIFCNVAIGNGTEEGIWILDSSYNRFTGLLEVGSNTGVACSVSGGTDPGLVDLTCANQGSSDAALTTAISFENSFVGKVTDDDAANGSDTNGAVAAPWGIIDWVNFDNAWRGWGKDEAAFPDWSNLGCADTTWDLRIWDWSLDSGDTSLLDALDVPGASDTLIHTWSNGSDTEEFLRNAVEIIGDIDADDRIGDDDGLCESGEDCVYTPNIGSYQGHDGLSGSYTTIGDIRLFEYSTNGR